MERDGEGCPEAGGGDAHRQAREGWRSRLFRHALAMSCVCVCRPASAPHAHHDVASEKKRG
eukprot:2125827-Pyramimonas_sp.AAC.1